MRTRIARMTIAATVVLISTAALLLGSHVTGIAAQPCSGGWYINDHAPDCLPGCQTGCSCAICGEIIVW